MLLPIDIRSGALITRIGRPTDSKSNTISRIAKSSFSTTSNHSLRYFGDDASSRRGHAIDFQPGFKTIHQHISR